jgi:hypothetical protein
MVWVIRNFYTDFQIIKIHNLINFIKPSFSLISTGLNTKTEIYYDYKNDSNLLTCSSLILANPLFIGISANNSKPF